MTAQHLEKIIEQTGGCGLYQVVLCLIIHSCKASFLSILVLVFGSYTPDWWCVDDMPGTNSTLHYLTTANNSLYKSCSNGNGTQCQNFYFDPAFKTLVTEWDLVCGQKWISSTIMSIQMAGFFVGCLSGGQIADLVGRKPPFYSALAAVAVLSVVAVFSVHWTMYAAIRFFIGIANGFQVTVMYSIQTEFVLPRWRTWAVAIPSWALNTIVFSLLIYLIPNWQHIHIVVAIACVVCLLSWWYVPESFRWKVVHNRIEEAEKIIQFVSKVNKTPVPSKQDIEELTAMVRGSELKEKDRKYSLLDLVRTRSVLKHTAMLFFIWITCGLSAYGIGFGVTDLSGELYQNLLISSAINTPLQFVIIFLQQRYGRKKTSILFFSIFTIFAAIVGVFKRLEESDTNLAAVRVCGLIALIASDAIWSPIQTLTIEIYPTVIRNTGYGFQNTMARVGAILAPQLVLLDSMFAGTLYFVCAVIGVISIILITQLPETSRKDLEDRLPEKASRFSHKQNHLT